MKKSKIIFTALILSTAMSITSLAGQWRQDAKGYWYENDDGSYPTNQWQEIDGEYYYFENAGYMLSNTVTPDNYIVGYSGQWIEPIHGEDKNIALDKETRVVGYISKVNYQWEWNTDSRRAYILTLPYSVNIYSNDGSLIKTESEIQLVEFENIDAYVDKYVCIEGEMFEGMTSWYIRDFGMIIDSISENN